MRCLSAYSLPVRPALCRHTHTHTQRLALPFCCIISTERGQHNSHRAWPARCTVPIPASYTFPGTACSFSYSSCSITVRPSLMTNSHMLHMYTLTCTHKHARTHARLYTHTHAPPASWSPTDRLKDGDENGQQPDGMGCVRLQQLGAIGLQLALLGADPDLRLQGGARAGH